MQFNAAACIKEIGRGKEGARGLSEQQACELYSAMLSGQVTPAQLGAALIALRVKGESHDELMGFMQALHQFSYTVSALAADVLFRLSEQSKLSKKPVVVIPSYNGARRRPNYTPLLAGLIAQKGFPVLVHGLDHDPTGRIASAEIFSKMQWPMQAPPQFLSIDAIAPELKALLDIRVELGVRNVTHTLVKCFAPASLGSAFLVTGYTHPEFLDLQTKLFMASKQNALVVRASEGEPVMAPNKLARMDSVIEGKLTCEAVPEKLVTTMPEPRPDISALASAEQTRYLLENLAEVPQPILTQAALVAKLAQ